VTTETTITTTVTTETTLMTTVTELREIDRDEMAGVDGGAGPFQGPGFHVGWIMNLPVPGWGLIPNQPNPSAQ
jgi:hypothetical protein